MTAVPASLPAARPRAAVDAEGSPWLIRLTAVVLLGLFGGAHWATLVRPSAGGDLFAMLIVAVAAGVLLSATPAPARRWARIAATAALLLAALGAILLVAGAPLWTLRPDHWDVLATEIAGGIGVLPALRVPYRGIDPWVRTVLLTGGGVLTLAALCCTLAPRPRTPAAAVCLGTLYVVPIIQHGPKHPYLDGAVFALLLCLLLWGDRLGGREAPMAVALAVGAVLIAAIAAPRLDSARPWVDYEALAESLQGGRTTTFTWNHHYGPIDWSRDGIELARVRTRGDLYLKTASLERFDGIEWRQARDVLSYGDDTEISGRHPQWSQTIHVDVKGLKSEPFLGAGTTSEILHSTRPVRPATPGTFEASAKPLRRGDGYDARVYVPRPSTTEMRVAGTDYPAFVTRQLRLELPAQPGLGRLRVDVAPWGSEQVTRAGGDHGFFLIDPQQVLGASPYARSYALAQQLRGASSDPYDYVRKVMARVQRDARYTETPPSPGKLAPLDAFLFRDHAGYCQYFAGATALLLRMGGVPARVAAGFSPGSRNGEVHVVRDLDAHSWVEVYFPRIGWVTFDPTPGDSPARSQITDTQRAPDAASGPRAPQFSGGDRTSDPTAGGTAAQPATGGRDATLPIAAGVLALGLLAGPAALAVRRRRRLARSPDPELEELRLALVRTGRAPAPDMTLRRLERLLGDSDGALGYLQALRLARYGVGAPPPTPAQRRALRRSLVAGLGLRSRLMALWVFPPRMAEVRAALRPRRRRPYTG